MSKRTTIGVSAPILLLLLLFAIFVVSMRTKYRPVQDRVRRFARDYGNPKVMETAGQPGSSQSIVRHIGRSSGKQYETPVETAETEDGFVIALPYGTNPDWLKNVMAAGSAVIIREGEEHQVENPELIPRSLGNPYFSRGNQLSHSVFAVDDFLRLRRVTAA